MDTQGRQPPHRHAGSVDIILRRLTGVHPAQATSEAERALPVILFMHGWPETWFSWRHQLKAVAAGGRFRGIAPDMVRLQALSRRHRHARHDVMHLLLTLSQRRHARA
jgi:pimeloyl-ACP methyl ester carboxylesterase